MKVKSNFVKVTILYFVMVSSKNYTSGQHASDVNPLVAIHQEVQYESPLGRRLEFSFSNVPMHASPQDSMFGVHNSTHSSESRELEHDRHFQDTRNSVTGFSARDARHQEGSHIEQAVVAQQMIVASNRTHESLLSEDIFPDLRPMQSETVENDSKKDVVDIELLRQDRNDKHESPQTQAANVSLRTQSFPELEMKKKKKFWSCCGSSDDVAAK